MQKIMIYYLKYIYTYDYCCTICKFVFFNQGSIIEYITSSEMLRHLGNPKSLYPKFIYANYNFSFRFYRKIGPRHVLMRWSIQKYYLKTQRDQRPGDLVELCELCCYTFHLNCSQPGPLLCPVPLEQQTLTHSKLLHCPHCRETEYINNCEKNAFSHWVQICIFKKHFEIQTLTEYLMKIC